MPRLRKPERKKLKMDTGPARPNRRNVPAPSGVRFSRASISAFVMVSAGVAAFTLVHAGSSPVPAPSALEMSPEVMQAESQLMDTLDERIHLHLKRLQS